MALMQGGGVTIDLPSGWDAEIYRRPTNTSALSATGIVEQTNLVLHAANFALPEPRGDFGSGAVELMERENLLIVLFEYNPDDAQSALFKHEGLPIPLSSEGFHPHNMQRARKGLQGCQHFFNTGDRAWCLYVVVAERGMTQSIADANAVLASVDMSAL